MAPRVMQGRTVDGGRVVVDEVIEGAATSARFRAHLVDDPQQRRLVTLASAQELESDDLRHELAMQVEGIAALEYVGRVDSPDGGAWRGVCIVEVEPRGRPAAELAPIAERDAVALGDAIAAVAARAHDRGFAVRGIRPELVYVGAGIGGAGRLAGLVPRAQLFLDSSRPGSHGLPILADLYRAPEDQLSFAPEPRSDVFALCATLFALVTGRHPFGEHPPAQMDGMMADRVASYPGSADVGALLTAGLRHQPADRPSLAELAARLRTL